MMNKAKMYEQNGIFLSKQKMSADDEVIIGYKGLLLTSGAQQVYMRVGYGEMWEDCEEMPMLFSDGMFKMKMRLKREGNMGIVFRDPANNWDNNSGQNYNFKIGKKVSRVKKMKNENKVAKSRK